MGEWANTRFRFIWNAIATLQDQTSRSRRRCRHGPNSAVGILHYPGQPPGLFHLLVFDPASDGWSASFSGMKFSSRLLLTPSTIPDVVDEAGEPSCYFSNGDLAEGYHTCDVKSPVSFCCPPGYACSSDNALCTLSTSSPEQPDVAPGTVSRDACTKWRWNGDSCGSNCKGKTVYPLLLCSLPLPPACRLTVEAGFPFLTCSVTRLGRCDRGRRM